MEKINPVEEARLLPDSESHAFLIAADGTITPWKCTLSPSERERLTTLPERYGMPKGAGWFSEKD